MFIRLIRDFYEFILIIFFFPTFLIYSWIYKSSKRTKKRIALGPTCLKPISYISEALKKYGYDTKTYVDNIYSINKRSDFDLFFFDKIRWKNNFEKIFLRYENFIGILKHFDIIITNFDGGFLRQTKLRYFEYIFLKIGNKKLIVWPYGSDSFIISRMKDRNFKYGLINSYPNLLENEKMIEKQIKYFEKHADFVVGNIPHNESLVRSDILTVACYGVDTDEWKPDPDFKHFRDGKNGEVIIIHCPNHRAVKGTKFLIDAVNKLIQEGLKINLKILEKVDNTIIKNEMIYCDIVAAQFLYGYATTEIEGMSLAKPVLSNLENGYYFDVARRYSHLQNCPIVSTAPENIKQNLYRLITNPELREKIGSLGRVYVEKYHSLLGQGLMWSKIIENVHGRNKDDIQIWWKSV